NPKPNARYHVKCIEFYSRPPPLPLFQQPTQAPRRTITIASKGASGAIRVIANPRLTSNTASGRLDLDWCWHQTALNFGCIMSINPDAHSIRELDHMHWGVEMARKDGVPPGRALNAMLLAEITRYFRQRRRSSAQAA